MNKDGSMSKVRRPEALKKLKKEMREQGVSLHTDLETISIALAQYQSGNPVTAKCVVCDKTLQVTDIPEIGKLWVTCDTGCMNFRESYS